MNVLTMYYNGMYIVHLPRKLQKKIFKKNLPPKNYRRTCKTKIINQLINQSLFKKTRGKKNNQEPKKGKNKWERKEKMRQGKAKDLQSKFKSIFIFF